MTAYMSSDPAEKTAPKPNITLLFAALMITMLLASLSQMVLSSALPTIVGELNGVEHMTWVITAYMLASTIMMPIYGKISDLFGRKPLLIAAILIFTAGAIVGAVADSMTTLILGRIVQGLGGGGLMILSQAAIADVVPARERGKYVGVLGGVFALSSVAGPLLGGWLTEGPGWRWAFWLNIPFGLLAVLAVAILLRLPKKPKATAQNLDYLGMAVLAMGTTVIVLIGTWGGSLYAWSSPQMIGLIIGAVASVGLFILVERRASEPVMPLAMFKDRNFNLATLAVLLTSVIMFGAVGYIPTYFQMAEGINATGAGLLMIPMMASLMLTSVVVGIVITKTGRYKLLPIVGSVVLAIGVVMLSTTTIDTPVYMICVYMAVMGIGIGTGMQTLTLVVQNSFPHKMVGTATAANNYFRQVGGSLGAAIVGSVFAARLTTIISERLPNGAGGSEGISSFTPELARSLPDAVRIPIVESYNEALMPIFVFMAPLAVIAVIALCFIAEKPLATEVGNEAPAEPLTEGRLAPPNAETTGLEPDDESANHPRAPK